MAANTFDLRVHRQKLDERLEEQRRAVEAQEREALAAMLNASALDLGELADKTPPERKFAWAPWIPARMVTLLHSYGGVGKSLLAQQIATAYALGQNLFGGATEGRPTLLLAAEDDHDEVWRRQLAICRRLGVRLDDVKDKLDILAVPHVDVTIAESTEGGALRPTPMLAVLRERIERRRHGLFLFDNSAKLFAVPEGNRIAVTRCVALLQGICHSANATGVLVAHDNKDGEFSGSTAWENSCRSRLHLKRQEDESISMRMPKANYSALGEMKLRWDDWSFRAEDPQYMTSGERLGAEMKARANGEIFLQALERLTGQGCNVSDKTQASNYAPKLILERGLSEGLSKRELHNAMILLLNEGRIRANEEVGQRANRSKIYGLARTV